MKLVGGSFLVMAFTGLVGSPEVMAVTHGAIVAMLVWSIKTQIAQGKEIARLNAFLERKR